VILPVNLRKITVLKVENLPRKSTISGFINRCV